MDLPQSSLMDLLGVLNFWRALSGRRTRMKSVGHLTDTAQYPLVDVGTRV